LRHWLDTMMEPPLSENAIVPDAGSLLPLKHSITPRRRSRAERRHASHEKGTCCEICTRRQVFGCEANDEAKFTVYVLYSKKNFAYICAFETYTIFSQKAFEKARHVTRPSSMR
jgi:hypothetical protein